MKLEIAKNKEWLKLYNELEEAKKRTHFAQRKLKLEELGLEAAHNAFWYAVETELNTSEDLGVSDGFIVSREKKASKSKKDLFDLVAGKMKNLNMRD